MFIVFICTGSPKILLWSSGLTHIDDRSPKSEIELSAFLNETIAASTFSTCSLMICWLSGLSPANTLGASCSDYSISLTEPVPPPVEWNLLSYLVHFLRALLSLVFACYKMSLLSFIVKLSSLRQVTSVRNLSTSDSSSCKWASIFFS